MSDFLSIASANKVADKFARSGLHAEKSKKVDAPVITEYPLTLECTVERFEDEPYGLRILGKIVDVLADESVLVDGKVDPVKLKAFAFNQMQNGVLCARGEGRTGVECRGSADEEVMNPAPLKKELCTD